MHKTVVESVRALAHAYNYDLIEIGSPYRFVIRDGALYFENSETSESNPCLESNQCLLNGFDEARTFLMINLITEYRKYVNRIGANR
jgi:hypothetical protein